VATKKDPIERRKEKVKEHPMSHILIALKHLDDPNLPISYETRMAIVEPLLRAKHFGKDKNNPQVKRQDGIDANGGSLDTQGGN
jgi:hypothetical protein